MITEVKSLQWLSNRLRLKMKHFFFFVAAMRVCLITTRFYRRRIVDSSWFFSLFFFWTEETRRSSCCRQFWINDRNCSPLYSEILTSFRAASSSCHCVRFSSILWSETICKQIESVLVASLLFKGLDRIFYITCLHICHTGAPFNLILFMPL